MERAIGPDYGPKFKKGGAKKGGGGLKRSPGETKAIQRQHSQEMMLRLQALRGVQWDGDQMRSVINWFEEDIAGKNRAIKWDGWSSDVPGDDTGLPMLTKED